MSRLFSSKPLIKHFIAITCTLLLLVACSSITTPPGPIGTAPEYRQQASLAIYEKRYNDAIQLLRHAITLEPTAADFLLLGDIQEALQQYRPALKTYTQGLNYASDSKLKQQLYFQLATLEALEFNHQQIANELAANLPAETAGRLNLQVIQAMQQKHFDKALQLSERITSDFQDQEMIGWAHYHAAQVWLAVGNTSKALGSLFNAVNYARGLGLVARATQLWDDLKELPLEPPPIKSRLRTKPG